MSETRSQWAPPEAAQPKSANDHLEARYADRENPDDMDDMVVLPGERKPQLIEVPNWDKNSGVNLEVSSEVELDDDPFSNGKEIIVERSEDKKTGAPAYLDGGWKIVDDQAMKEIKPGSGKYVAAVKVEKEIDGVPYIKVISLEKVYKLNPHEVAPTPETGEKIPLTEAQEEIADEAIEDALGIEDPSEIDGRAKVFTADERRALREAAGRVSNLETEPVNPYDALLDPNTPNVVEKKDTRPDVYTYLKEALPPVTRGDTEASRKYYDKFVTEENRQMSLDFLSEAVKADRKIAAILYEAGLKPTDMAAVDAIRENPDVRYEVAKRLTQKLDSLADSDPDGFGFRVTDNSPNNLKVDPQTGKRMKSRMYAVDMALKMLGGEFSERNEANDFARDKNDRVAIGQHRHAARTTILSRY